jgi:hypothetical protein
MKKSNNSYFIISLIFIITILIVIIIMNYNNIIEKFDGFSPYQENNSYPWVYEKHLDQKAFRKTLNQWEKPFNCHNEGYINAEPKGLPPLVPIYSFTEMKNVKFNEES